MIPKIERYTDILKQPLTRQKQKVSRECLRQKKAVKEKDGTQMPVAKKKRTDHKCLWQRKKDQITNAGGKRRMAALIRQANS